MDDEGVAVTVVDPEVRAYVYSLVTALGGTGADEYGRYVLGDEGLACLKDIKRWLRLYDEKANRLDVARCLAEANLVNGDLLEILAAWPENATNDKLRTKIALACLELLVPLTWPIEKGDQEMTRNHHRHIPYIQLAQLNYKRGILEHPSSSILRAAIRTGLPSIALPMNERNPRDEGIIKLLLYFFRNIAIMSPPEKLPIEWNENEISRSATIEAFHKQDVLALLLTMASNMGDDFNIQDVILLEVLFHLVKGIDVEKLFMNEAKIMVKKADELKGIIARESGMRRSYAKDLPTRHNRFGTMIWVKRDDDKVSTVSGQDTLADNQRTLSKMDQSKKWNRPKQRGRKIEEDQNIDTQVPLTTVANEHLRSFVEEFLDSGFNPLFSHIRRAVEREADRVLEAHSLQYFYLVGWFLEAERVRRKAKKEADLQKQKKLDEIFEPDSFGLVASVLNQETFIALNRFMQDRLDIKSWEDVKAGMKCFTQILLTVQEMAESPLEEDQEIAENIQNRIFYEETTHDRIVDIVRGYKDQGFGYLNACTELPSVFLRMLERYSKENTDLQIRSKRRARKAKKPDQVKDDAADQDSEIEEIAEAQRVSRERKFDFNRFSAKFLTQSCINTHVAFTGYYKDLNREQLKRAHRFFYRVAFKQEMSVLLFRMDIIALFHKIIKGPEGLDPANSMFKEWEELTRQLFRRLIKKFQQRPELAIEVLFSKINSTAYFLEHGYEKQTMSSRPRAPAELLVKGGMDRDAQIGVAVAALLLGARDQEKFDAVDFVRKTISSVIDERRSWETEAEARKILENSGDQDIGLSRPPFIAVKPDNDERRVAMFKDNKLRLLMTLAGWERLGEDEPDASWIIPSSETSSDLQETHNIITKHRDDPVMHYGDDADDQVSAIDMLVRKSAVRQKVAYDDDSEGDSNGEEDFLFPPNARAAPRSKSDALSELKKKRRKRRSADSEDDEGEPLDEEALRARRKARQENERARRRKIKSTEFITSSDDEDNEERDIQFFAMEEARRVKYAKAVEEALSTAKAKPEKKTKKRKSAIEETNASDMDMASSSRDDLDLNSSPAAKKKRKQSPPEAPAQASSDLESEDEEEERNINLSPRRPQTLRDSSPPASPASSEKSSGEPAVETETSNTPLSSSPHPSNRLTKNPFMVRDDYEDADISEQSRGNARSPVKDFQGIFLADRMEGLSDGEDEDLPMAPRRRRGGPVLVDDDDDDDSE